MRILIVSEVFYPEDFIITDLALEWVRMGHSVDVLTQYPSYPKSYVYEGYENKGRQIEEWEGIKIHRFPFIEGYCNSKIRKFSNYLKFIFDGSQIAKRLGNQFDCIFVSQTGPLTVAFPGIALSQIFHIPLFIWTCDIWPDVVYSYGVPKNYFTSKVLAHVIRKVYASCTGIFVSSKRFADQISLYTDKPITYAPNWLRPVQEVESDIQLNPAVFNFTFTGNVSRYQNLINTIQGFAQANLPNAVLNVFGDGSFMSAIRDLVSHLNNDRIILHGRVPYNQIHSLLKQSDVLVLPLIPDEGIMKTEPYKLQSYLHAQKPVFGILSGSGKEIIESANIGLCSKPDDIDDIACGFVRMVTFADQHAVDIAQKADNLICDRFDKDKIVRCITETLSLSIS